MSIHCSYIPRAAVFLNGQVFVNQVSFFSLTIITTELRIRLCTQVVNPQLVEQWQSYMVSM